jgi:phage-related protein
MMVESDGGGLASMSKRTYIVGAVKVECEPKDLIWFSAEVTSPPFSVEADREAGILLGQLRQGVLLSLPHSRPMSNIGNRCHELRIQDKDKTWRIIYRIDPDAIVVLDVFKKKDRTTPKPVIERCQRRLTRYIEACR